MFLQLNSMVSWLYSVFWLSTEPQMWELQQSKLQSSIQKMQVTGVCILLCWITADCSRYPRLLQMRKRRPLSRDTACPRPIYLSSKTWKQTNWPSSHSQTCSTSYSTLNLLSIGRWAERWVLEDAISRSDVERQMILEKNAHLGPTRLWPTSMSSSYCRKISHMLEGTTYSTNIRLGTRH